jgi:hypothetical protein
MSTIIGATTVQALRILRSWGMSQEQANRFLAMDDREIRVAEVISADCAFRLRLGDDHLLQWMSIPNGWFPLERTPIQQLLETRYGLDWLLFAAEVEEIERRHDLAPMQGDGA